MKTEQNQDIKGKLSQIIKFYDKLYERIYNLSAEEFLKEFLNHLKKKMESVISVKITYIILIMSVNH